MKLEEGETIDSGPLFRKDNGRILKVTINKFRGKIYIHIREYDLDGDTNIWFPTSKGYALTEETLSVVVDALESAHEYLASTFKYEGKQIEFNFEGENHNEY